MPRVLTSTSLSEVLRVEGTSNYGRRVGVCVLGEGGGILLKVYWEWENLEGGGGVPWSPCLLHDELQMGRLPQVWTPIEEQAQVYAHVGN